jgi:hypothetical protein
MSPISNKEEQRVASADIEVTAHGNRRAVEALYLELRELAKQHGLEVEYRLTRSKPEDAPDS